MRRSVLFGPVVAMAILLAGCSTETPGKATADDEGGGRPTVPTEETTEVESTESSPSPGSATSDLRPCDLLTTDEQATFDFGPGEEKQVGPARSCQWQATGEHTVTVGVIDELGLDDVQSNGAKEPLKVGSHDAVRYEGALGTCGIAIGVTESSRVDILGGTNDGDLTRGCTVANQAAQLVEPKLP